MPAENCRSRLSGDNLENKLVAGAVSGYWNKTLRHDLTPPDTLEILIGNTAAGLSRVGRIKDREDPPSATHLIAVVKHPGIPEFMGEADAQFGFCAENHLVRYPKCWLSVHEGRWNCHVPNLAKEHAKKGAHRNNDKNSADCTYDIGEHNGGQAQRRCHSTGTMRLLARESDGGQNDGQAAG